MKHLYAQKKLFRRVFNYGLAGIAKKKTEIIFATTLLACGLSMNQANAEIPEMHVFANAPELSDVMLAEARGKFVTGGQIMSFGVSMVTEWITASGEVINASANLHVGMNGAKPQAHFQPSITVQQIQPNPQTSTSGNNIVSGSQGLENVSGVVQRIQVAGRSNGIGNSIGINVKRNQSGAGNQLSSSSRNQTMNVLTPGGNNANVSLVNNGLSVGVKVANQGTAMQSIRSVAQGNGQVMQSVQLTGNLNRINNLINLDVQTRSISSGPSVNALQVLSSLSQISNTQSF